MGLLTCKEPSIQLPNPQTAACSNFLTCQETSYTYLTQFSHSAYFHQSSKQEISKYTDHSTYLKATKSSFYLDSSYTVLTTKNKSLRGLLESFWYNHSFHFVVRRWNSFKSLQTLKRCSSPLSLMRNHTVMTYFCITFAKQNNQLWKEILIYHCFPSRLGIQSRKTHYYVKKRILNYH